MTHDDDAAGRLIYLIAGEPSGDLLGARLMAALGDDTDHPVRFAGIGGERMTAMALRSLFPMAELSVMGLVEVLPRAPQLLKRIRETVADIRETRPDIVVTIDSPGFCFRVASKLKGAGIPLVHYVAPTVWAWRPRRAAKVARLYDHLLALLPFEPPYFEREGLACTFVGHPAVEEAPTGSGAEFRAAHSIPADVPLLAVLPGSRVGEVTRMLPVFSDAVEILAGRLPNLHAVVPTVPAVAEIVAGATNAWPVPTTTIGSAASKPDAFAAADAAIAASGTVTLELGVARTPMIVAYKMAPLTMAIAKRLVRVSYITLLNLVLGRGAVPEFIQEDCTAQTLADEAERLLVDRAARDDQISAIEQALAALGGGTDGHVPSQRAARVVRQIIEHAAK